MAVDKRAIAVFWCYRTYFRHRMVNLCLPCHHLFECWTYHILTRSCRRRLAPNFEESQLPLLCQVHHNTLPEDTNLINAYFDLVYCLLIILIRADWEPVNDNIINLGGRLKGFRERIWQSCLKVHWLAHFTLQPRFEISEIADCRQIIFVDNFLRKNPQAHIISTIKISTDENTKLPPKTR